MNNDSLVAQVAEVYILDTQDPDVDSVYSSAVCRPGTPPEILRDDKDSSEDCCGGVGAVDKDRGPGQRHRDHPRTHGQPPADPRRQNELREVEMAVGPFAVSRARETVCDFSEPVYSENMAVLMVWLLTLAATLSVCLAFYSVVKCEANLFGLSRAKPWGEAVMWVIKALTQESTTGLPATDGARVVVATWLLASLVFMSSYSGILTAMLTVPRVTIPIDSVEDLVSQGDLPWRLEAGSMMYQYYQEATEGVRKQVFDGHEGTFQDCWAAREPISRGEFAGICDVTTMKKAMSWDFRTILLSFSLLLHNFIPPFSPHSSSPHSLSFYTTLSPLTLINLPFPSLPILSPFPHFIPPSLLSPFSLLFQQLIPLPFSPHSLSFSTTLSPLLFSPPFQDPDCEGSRPHRPVAEEGDHQHDPVPPASVSRQVLESRQQFGFQLLRRIAARRGGR
ncbi:carbonate dehydratase, eukaryotic-type [Penaeus vannamei]|uniref:Carbonate dehydratase, eukaryotic-type n=1 Tax=Penaeus vannamei TaxID=6689 RepID=A0A423SLN7_PENVA|nr:carbonate dehydratase, eukaryotic-type [Penaeus vannamei]